MTPSRLMNSCALIVPMVSGPFGSRRRRARRSPFPRTGNAHSTSKRQKVWAAVCSQGGPLADQEGAFDCVGGEFDGDRKSTRLNSSHLGISYAVFCLEK